MIEPADIALTGVTKRYGSVVAVDAINLTIPQRTSCRVLRPSGCGKTTTLRMGGFTVKALHAQRGLLNMH